MTRVQTSLPTEHGAFNITVYEGLKGQEVIVLSTGELDINKPVYMRVHSECITGDTFGSLKCDCGPQKSESLKIIAESGNGVFIYLRQEGRGIGLFEKMKTYQLQEAGYDTFEANIHLGHRADARTYEVVKMVCDDFEIKQIKLITNNPSKIRDIARLGIKIIERIPLVVIPNQDNVAYIATKSQKFQHAYGKTLQYFYGVHGVQSQNDAQEIGKFLEDRVNDPLLKIYLSNRTIFEKDLYDQDLQREVTELFQTISRIESCIPIIHFSFRDSSDPLSDIILLYKIFPSCKHLQLNDMPHGKEEEITRLAACYFQIILPLSNTFFTSFIQNEAFAQYTKENDIFLLLDNSFGTGMQDSVDNYLSKIEQLLDYGLNNIVLAGGFGPDTLDSYFRCCEYFRINLSIDAETRLKTNGVFDVSKTKQYLQLLLSNE